MPGHRITLQIDGRPVQAAAGITVAAALANAGIAQCRTSVSGEARGPLCAMGICYECRVTIDGVAQRRACMTICDQGMEVATSAGGRGAAPGGVGGPAGEGQGQGQEEAAKTARAAETAKEAAARLVAPGAAAAMAPVAAAVEASTFEEIAVGVVRADIAIVGGGPAGIAAACRAAEAGRNVVVLDQGVAAGGQVWRPWLAAAARLRRAADETTAGGHGATGVGGDHGEGRGRRPAGGGRGGGGGDGDGPRTGAPSDRRAAAWLRRLNASGARWIGGASVIDVLPGFVLLAMAGGRALRVEARQLILAGGARELFLPFPGWTLPDVLGLGGAQALLKSGADVRGRRVVVAGSGPLILPVAAALARAGAHIVAVAEQAPASAVARFAARLWRRPALLLQATRYRAAFWRSRYRTGVWVREAIGSEPAAAGMGDGSPGGAALRAVMLTDGTRSWTVECDLLACAYGLVPNLELPRLAGCAEDRQAAGGGRRVELDEQQRSSVGGVWCAGEAGGIGGLDMALASGEIAGAAAAGSVPETRLLRRRDRQRRHADAMVTAFALRPELRRLAGASTIVCRCEDVALGAIDPAWTPRQAKLYTRAGMGPCQGRVCGAALETLLGWEDADRSRPPAEPIAVATLGELAGAAPPLAALTPPDGAGQHTRRRPV